MSQDSLIAQTLSAVDDTTRYNGPFDRPAITHAAVRAIGAEAGAAGGSSPDTMFGEGSVGKVRFAGLAYMLEQEKLLNMDEKVVDYFARPESRAFLTRKYGRDIADDIIALFAREDNKDATLADLTTHYSGVGDNTRTNFGKFHTDGIMGDWPLDKQLAHVNRDADGRVEAMDNRGVRQKAAYGQHQYSNLGYMILGDVIEIAANKGAPKDAPLLTYKDALRDRMIRPLGGLTGTKFPEELDEEARATRVARSTFSDPSGTVVDTVDFKGAGSAGGVFTSSRDIHTYFQEFFKGFPKHIDDAVTEGNAFFKTETIQRMVAEWKKHPPANQKAIDEWEASDKSTPRPNPRYQAPGFTAEIDPAGNIVSYDKTGETFGYKSHMVYRPQTDEVDIQLEAFENTSPASLAALPEFYAHKIVGGKPEDAALRKDVARYVAGQYTPDELQFRGRDIIKNVAQYIGGHEGALPTIKIPLETAVVAAFSSVDHEALMAARRTLRGAGVVTTDTDIPVASAKPKDKGLRK